MNIVKFNPMYPGRTFSNVLDEIFNRSLGDFVGFDNTQTIPSVNIKETEATYELELAAPGFDKADFQVKLENDMLTIAAGKKQEENKQEGKYARKEFHYEKFSRSFTLPDTADSNQIGAKYENGVLHLSIAKKEEAKVQPAKTIEIQ